MIKYVEQWREFMVKNRVRFAGFTSPTRRRPALSSTGQLLRRHRQQQRAICARQSLVGSGTGSMVAGGARLLQADELVVEILPTRLCTNTVLQMLP